MKLAILSHFSSFQDSYALHVGWLERAKMFEYFRQDFDFLVNDNCRDGDFPHQKNVLKRISDKKNFDKRTKFYLDQYVELLLNKDMTPKYDIVFTADMIYQAKGNFLAQNKAIRIIADEYGANCIHWVHSGWVHPPEPGRTKEMMESGDQEYLRFMHLDPRFHKIVCLSNAEKMGIARQYDVPLSSVQGIHNPKDFRAFQDFDPLAWKITKDLEVWNKDVVQIFPFCSSRMDAKGIDVLIEVFSGLKKEGANICLILANANYKSHEGEVQAKKGIMVQHGLVEGEDFFFTSDILGNTPLPRKAVADLFSISNVFVFASWRETASNILYEAKISGNLLVLTNRIPAIMEGGGDDAIYFDATHRTLGVVAGEEGDLQNVSYHNKDRYFSDLAKQILEKLPSRKHIWEWSYENIWYNEMQPLLYGKEESVAEEKQNEGNE